MSVHEHRESAPRVPVNVWVVVASSTRTAATDESGAAIAAMLHDAGHRVLDRTVVDDDVDTIRNLVRSLADDGTTQAIVLTGGTGLSRRDVTPEALEPLFDRTIPGFGELFRSLSFPVIGSAAMLSRATAGLIGSTVVFAMPGSRDACALALEKLVLPELAHIVRELVKEGPPGARSTPAPAPSRAESKPKEAKPEAAKAEPPTLAPPSGTLGRLGRNTLSVGLDPTRAAPAPTDATPGEQQPSGWLRAVYEIKGEVIHGTFPELPEDIEKVSPVIDVLHTSGERGSLKLPSGRTFALFGWPNLTDKGSKVLAIASGSPIAEILALHRYPVQTGTCVDEVFGLLPRRSESVTPICEAVTGRAPKDTSGQLFAVQGDGVWIQRGTRAIRWDGSKERDDGTLKQALASLVLDWSRR